MKRRFCFTIQTMKKKRKLKKQVKLSIVLVLCALVLVFLAVYTKMNSVPQEVMEEVTVEETIAPTPVPTPTPPLVVDEMDYAEMKEINADYVGHMWFESGLIDQPVVQGTDNEYYLHVDMNKEYYSSGTVFMDYRNTLEDMNLILYGHYVYADETLMFSPLHVLEDPENYEENQYIYFGLEDRILKYQVAFVYNFDLYDYSAPLYYETSYTEEAWNTYINAVQARVYYDTGVEVTREDRLLSMQTCVRNRDDLRLIVVAKLIEEYEK